MSDADELPKEPWLRERRTRSYWNFAVGMRRTKDVLDAGLIGIQQATQQVDEILGKFSTYGERAKEQLESLPADHFEMKRGEGDNLKLTLGKRSHELIVEAITIRQSTMQETRFHFHGILCVSVWTAFETYIQDLMQEVFHADPEMLRSERSLTFEEAVSARGDIVAFSVERELAEIGRLSFRRLSSYLKGRLKYQLTDPECDKLDQLYVVRNVSAHANGRIRAAQMNLVPEEIPIVEGELRIPAEYVTAQIRLVGAAVDKFDRHVCGSVLKPEQSTV